MTLLKCKNILVFLTIHDLFNVFEVINNLVKQHEKNSKYFF